MVADLFHYGHIEFLRRISGMGDYVLVGINADDIAEIHKRRPIQTMEKRIASVLACRYVDEVIPNAPWFFDPAWIEKYDIGLVVHGDDYSDERQRDMYKVPIERGIFRTVPYTRGISTTEIIRWRGESQRRVNAVDPTASSLLDVTGGRARAATESVT